MKRMTMILAIMAIFTASGRGQGFLNLNFEAAYDLPYPTNDVRPVSVSVTNALPDWTAYSGPPPSGSVFASIFYVSNFSGGFSSAVQLEGGSLALSGDFSVGLFEYGLISQTGQVPSNAESLEFEAEGPAAGRSLEVTLGGQTLLYSLLSEGPAYGVYGANIPADMDGQMEALTFGIPPPEGTGFVLLDNIEFLSESVPEPRTMALIASGGLLIAWRFRKKRRESRAMRVKFSRIVNTEF
jgi:hypothetical protein